MSNTGRHNQTGAKTFQKEGKGGEILPFGFIAIGATTMGMAVLTALTPPPAPFLAKAAGMLDQVGFDKGPLLMFGLLSTAMGFALWKLEKASRGGSAAADAASFAGSNAKGLESQSAILGSVQAELGALRGEIALARQEAKEAKAANPENNGEASDPIFRLAASLDQLGAQVDKRIDKARREMVEAVASVASSVEVGATQRDEAFSKNATEMDAVRMDIADLRAQLTRVATDVSSTKTSVEARPQVAATPAAVEAPSPEVKPEMKAEAPSAAPALPVELTDATEEEPVAQASSPGPTESSEPSGNEEPQFEGFQFDAEEEKTSEPEAPSLGVNMQSLGFPEPPAPMPKPSEDLGLIDQMQEDTANKGDETPPLFPDAFDQN